MDVPRATSEPTPRRNASARSREPMPRTIRSAESAIRRSNRTGLPRSIIGRTRTHSKSLGGRIDRYRFLSKNRQVQWLFFAGPRLVWLAPPQALTTELSSYGVRTVDALVDDELCIPAYEYHFEEYPGEPDSLHSQIPPGFAGDPNPFDPDRADASPWIDRLPLVREFRKKVLKRSR